MLGTQERELLEARLSHWPELAQYAYSLAACLTSSVLPHWDFRTAGVFLFFSFYCRLLTSGFKFNQSLITSTKALKLMLFTKQYLVLSNKWYPIGMCIAKKFDLFHFIYGISSFQICSFVIYLCSLWFLISCSFVYVNSLLFLRIFYLMRMHKKFIVKEM